MSPAAQPTRGASDSQNSANASSRSPSGAASSAGGQKQLSSTAACSNSSWLTTHGSILVHPHRPAPPAAAQYRAPRSRRRAPRTQLAAAVAAPRAGERPRRRGALRPRPPGERTKSCSWQLLFLLLELSPPAAASSARPLRAAAAAAAASRSAETEKDATWREACARLSIRSITEHGSPRIASSQALPTSSGSRSDS